MDFSMRSDGMISLCLGIMAVNHMQSAERRARAAQQHRRTWYAVRARTLRKFTAWGQEPGIASKL
jgi:hypothetical protein